MQLVTNESTADVPENFWEDYNMDYNEFCETDTVTPYFMGKDIYDSIKGTNKQIWTVEDSEHVMMWIEYNREYREKVTQLLDSIEN